MSIESKKIKLSKKKINFDRNISCVQETSKQRRYSLQEGILDCLVVVFVPGRRTKHSSKVIINLTILKI